MQLEIPSWPQPAEKDAQTDAEKESLASLINALNEHQLTEDFVAEGNQILGNLATQQSSTTLTAHIKKTRAELTKLAATKMKLSPPGHYTSQWMVLGMSVFGLPIGLMFMTALDNAGLLALGLPIGLGIGIALGSGMDAKAKEEGRQLILK